MSSPRALVEGGLGFVMTLLRTMKGTLNCFVQSVSGVVVLRIGTKSQSQPMNSTLIKGCFVVWNRAQM
jgi:uncharacterized membrane protein